MKFTAWFGFMAGINGCGTESPVSPETCIFDDACDDGDGAAEVCLYGTCISRPITGQAVGALVFQQPFRSVDPGELRYALMGDEHVLLGRFPTAAFDEDIKLREVPLLFRTLTVPESIQNIGFAVDREAQSTSEGIAEAPGQGERIGVRLRDFVLPVDTSRELLLVADVSSGRGGAVSSARLLPVMPNLPSSVSAVGLWSGIVLGEDQVTFPGGDLLSWTTVVVAAIPDIRLSLDISCEEMAPIADQIVGVFDLGVRTNQPDGELDLVAFTVQFSSNLVTRAPRRLRALLRDTRGDEQTVFMHTVPAGELVSPVAVPPEALPPVTVRSPETRALVIKFDLQDAGQGSFLQTSLADPYWRDTPGAGEVFGPLPGPFPACELNW